jgi:hypothetical protein
MRGRAQPPKIADVLRPLDSEVDLMAPERNVQFSAPTWLRDLGFSSWLLVGFVLIIIGLIWVLGETSTIVMPVILATCWARSPDRRSVGWSATEFPASAARSSCCWGSLPSAC